MWIPGGMIFLAALSVVFFRWQVAGGADGAARPDPDGDPCRLGSPSPRSRRSSCS